MSDFSLTLVLHFKTSKYFNGMAKVQIKSEKITPFGGIFHVREQFPVLWVQLSTLTLKRKKAHSLKVGFFLFILS